MFGNSRVGLSICDEAIRFAKLKRRSGSFKLVNYGEEKLPPGIVEGGVIKDQEALTEALHSISQRELLNSALVALPTEEKNLLADYKEVFQNAKVLADEFETEEKSIARALFEDDIGTFMVINFGKFSSTIFIISNGIISFVSSLDIGGNTILRVTEESDRREHSLTRETIVKEVASATMSGAQVLREEVEKYFMLWHSGRGGEDFKRSMIEKIFLCGSDAGIKGLDEYLSVSLKTKVELANVWINILDPAKNIPNMTFRESLAYAPALGAALGNS